MRTKFSESMKIQYFSTPLNKSTKITNNMAAQHPGRWGGIGGAGLGWFSPVYYWHTGGHTHCSALALMGDNSFSYIAFISCVTCCCYACNCGLVIIHASSSTALFTVLHWPGVWTQVLRAVLGRLPDHQNHRGRNGPGIYQHRPHF